MKIFLLPCIALLIFSCAESPDLSPIPYIEFVSISKNIMKQGSINQDSIIIELKFEDGDGDLGYVDDKRKADLFVIDKRTDVQYDSYIVPSIPQKGTNNGIRGTMKIKLYTQCCKLYPCSPEENQADELLPLDIYLFDRALNKSNIVTVNGLSLKCY